ncbi:hypothetical protein AUC47_04935 [Microbacterium sp. SZ1]|uniref:hypothetical protein n=1 Tax=Microbacterium sp. SZ1 TaxID=1849736 RepID=UPI000BBCD5F7|nr:hypothetical protein [Microbacterium sp. SZ1]PCE13996.1 hypothetical protein AUC47_04935 [Microbacterium sp. SZ1]
MTLEEALTKRITEANLTERDVAGVMNYADGMEPGDAEHLASCLWSMGGGIVHDGCPYADGDSDADYENDCPTCAAHLLAVSRSVLSDAADVEIRRKP